MAKIFLIFIESEAGHVLNLFLFSQIFEPQRSYKHGSCSTNSVYSLIYKTRKCVYLTVYFHLGDLDTVLVPLLSQIWSHIYNKTEYMNSLLEGALLFFFQNQN